MIQDVEVHVGVGKANAMRNGIIESFGRHELGVGEATVIGVDHPETGDVVALEPFEKSLPQATSTSLNGLGYTR